MNRPHNLFGKRFGSFKVIGIVPVVKRSKNSWLCQCDCGTRKLVRAGTLIRGNSKSCGCRRHFQNKHHPNWKGYEEISGNYFRMMKNRARKKKIQFSITIEQVWNLFLKQNGKCFLTGLPIAFPTCDSERSNGTASLDRIDSTKGYVKGNLQWVHKDVNVMKMDLTIKDFLRYCQLICQHKKLL